MIRRFTPDRPEVPDVPQEATPELERDLLNMASLNRRFGAWKSVMGKLSPLLRSREPLRILDLATGSADIPRAVVRNARKWKCPISITAVELQGATLEIAKKHSGDYPEISFVQADILDYEPAASFDILMCNFVLHRFDEVDVIRLLRRFPLMAHHGVLITDLRRSRLAQVSISGAAALFYRERMTLHDASQSVERAFSYPELHRLAVAAGWWGFEHRRIPYFRQLLWLDPEHPRR